MHRRDGNQLIFPATYSSLAYNNHRRNGNQLTFPATYSSLEYKIYRKNGNQLTSSTTYSSLERKISGTVTIPLPGMSTLKKFKYENVHKMKNKPDPALLRTSFHIYRMKSKKGFQNIMRLSL
jgi:hypothetical protein